jgi:hypothetical protein
VFAIGALCDEMMKTRSVLCFGTPLVLLPISPEDEEGSKKDGEQESEPSTIRDLCQGGAEEQTVEGDEWKPYGDNQNPVRSPYHNGDDGNYIGRNKGNKDDTDAIGMSEAGGLANCQNWGV